MPDGAQLKYTAQIPARPGPFPVVFTFDGYAAGVSGGLAAPINGTPADMTPEAATKVLQLCFAVYQASEIGSSVDPRTVVGSVTPAGWADW